MNTKKQISIRTLAERAIANGSKYFNPKSMKFFGDTYLNMTAYQTNEGYEIHRTPREWLGNPDFTPPITYMDNNFQVVSKGE